MTIRIPTTGRGRRSAAQQAKYDAEVDAFCEAIIQIDTTLDFKVSARGWCYILEEHGLAKGDFDKAQRLISDCRKRGSLPLEIVAEDGGRATENIEQGLDWNTPEEEAEELYQHYVSDAWDRAFAIADEYKPESFWEEQEYYVEVLVEKVDLKNLFANVCRRYHVAITNARGWSDLNSRAAIMRRFKQWESASKQCVLLYCGDHDPGGLHISDFIRSNMAELESVRWSPTDLIIDRFGLNYDFIVANNLSWVENLETSSGGRLDDPRHRDHLKPYVQDYLTCYGVRKVEANALVVRPEAGRELCQQAIEKYIPFSAVEEYGERMEAVRDEVREYLEALRGDAA